MTSKKLNECERLIVEQLRLELRLCELREKETPTPKMKALLERMRSIVRTRSEIWFDIIGLLRMKERIKYLRGEAKTKAQSAYVHEKETVDRRWAAREAGVAGSAAV